MGASGLPRKKSSKYYNGWRPEAPRPLLILFVFILLIAPFLLSETNAHRIIVFTDRIFVMHTGNC